MHFRFEAHSDHIQGVLDTALIVDDVALGDDFQNLPVHGDYHRSGGFEDPGDVVMAYFPDVFPVFAGNRHDAPRIDAVDVVSPDAGPAGTRFLSAHSFRGFDSGGY
jgi:hypothetical protein